MTGQLLYMQMSHVHVFHPSPKVGGELPNKHTHIIFSLDNQSTLYYNDTRQFGWIKILKEENVKHLGFFKSLGPEPLKELTLKKFTLLLQAKRPIKPLLMDQQKI